MSPLTLINNKKKPYAPHHSRPGSILFISSGKGGVGKTWVSVTLAHALAEQGQRILLFDGDLGLANVDIQLGLMPENDIGHFIEGQCTLEKAIQCVPEAQFDVIAGRSGCGSLATLSPQRLSILRECLRKMAASYDHVIVDVGAGLGSIVQRLTHVASHCFVVINQEPTSLTDAYAFIKITTQALPELELSIVVNQAPSYQDGQETYETLRQVCESFLAFSPPLAGIIRRDWHVPETICHQIPLLIRHPNCDAAGDMRRLSQQLTTRVYQELA